MFVYGFMASDRKDLPISISLGGVSRPWQTNHRQDYDEYNCGCPRSGPPISSSPSEHNNNNNNNNNKSLCSDWSSSRGPGQRVVTYTVYGDMNNSQVYKQYFSAIEDRIKNVQQKYEGWIMRLYHNTSESNSEVRGLLCRLYCQYPIFDPCQVNHIYFPIGYKSKFRPPSPTLDHVTSSTTNTNTHKSTKQMVSKEYGEFKDTKESRDSNNSEETVSPDDESRQTTRKLNHKSIYKVKRRSYGEALVGKMWRFLPMADPLVSEFLVRDIDSVILPREVAAVNQWLANSTALVHIMRDHPSHNGLILAGMWGGSRTRGGAKLTSMLAAMARWPPRDLWDYDQALLRREVWPEVLDSLLAHDSYFCANPHFQSHHRSAPFPTRRKGRYFVGWGPLRNHELPSISICPHQCRPPDHQDWTLC
ncbi:hypothetical protein Pmani_029249 [Petrolisthes manimaculis]|uniref:Uncharacterized protein n=1 Tax=Petrolisthes manimaculis TaxID=1843537 RepID=A0AAE1TU19_9EUCA|nr:hypothetical protein Pmani_029249 [Petrolisthes manimaculis]